MDQIIKTKAKKIKKQVVENNSKKHDIYYELAKELLSELPAEEVVATLLSMGYKSLNPESYNNISQISSKKEEVVRLFIALGKQSGINKNQLIDYIVKNTGISSKVISDITVLDKFSFITVPYREAEIILSVFKKRGRRSIVSKARARN